MSIIPHLTITSHFYPAPMGQNILSYQDIYPRNYYQPYNAITNPNGYTSANFGTRQQTLLQRAVAHIASSVPAGLDIDFNNDGYVDNVIFIVKGNVGSWGELLWPQKSTLSTVSSFINGKRVWEFNFMLEGSSTYFNVGVLSHEMLHTLSYPDLYHYNSDGLTPAGGWDIMASTYNPPQQSGAYTKWKYGNWANEPTLITAPGTYTINSLGSVSGIISYKIPSSKANEYFVIEHRNTANSFDAVPGSGLLIYRINTNFKGNAQYDGSTKFDEVYIYRPGGTSPTVNGTINTANYGTGGRTAFNSSTSPRPFFSDGTYYNDLNINNISFSGNTATFTCSFPSTTYSVTFNSNGGTGAMANQTFTHGVAKPLNANAFSKVNYIFIGWNTNSDGTGIAYTNQQSISLYANTTLYAQWAYYQTTFPWAEGFEGDLSKWSQQFEEGALNWTHRTGSFNGVSPQSGSKFVLYWSYDYSKPKTKLISPVLNLTSVTNPILSYYHIQPPLGTDQSTLTVYYRSSPDVAWVQLQTFPNSITTWKIDSILLPNKSATYQIAFEGKDNWGNPVGVDNIIVKSSVSSPATYTVTFNGNGSTGGSMANQTYTQGVSQVLNANTFTRNSYTFSGWNTNAGGTGTNYSNQQSITISANTTLYAKWTPKTNIAINETPQTLTYDGNVRAFTVTSTSPTGLTGFSVSYSTPNPTNVASYNVTITRPEDATYNAYNKTITAGLVINPKTITITGFNITKVYVGNVTVTNWGTTSFNGLVSGQTSTVSSSSVVGSYNNANVGTGKAVTFTGTFAMSGGTAVAGNYTLTQPSGLTGAITSASVTVTANAKSKIYNTVNPTLDYVSVPASLISGNTFSGALTTTATQSSNVGNYPINQGTLAIASGNYTISYVGANLTITPVQIAKPTVTGILTYNGAAQSPTIATNAAYVITTNVQTNAGSYNATVTLNANYQWDDATTAPLSLVWSIGTKPLTISGFNINKVYDGTVTVTNWGTLSFVGLSGGQTATVNNTGVVGSYNNANVGTGKSVSFTGAFAITGGTAVATNYSVTPPTGLTGVITLASIAKPTVTSGALTYNGSAQSPTIAANAAYTITNNLQTNAGSYNATVTLNANYQWADATTAPLSLAWSIFTKPLTINGFNIAKAYDGTVTVSTWGTLTFVGLIGAQTSNVSTAGVVGSFNNANVGTGKSVSFTGTFAMTGGTALASNYSITPPTGLTGTITTASVTVTANAKSKVYNALLPTLDYVTVPASLIAGNTFSGTLATTATQTSNIGVYSITEGTLAISSGNYSITYVGANLTITPIEVAQPTVTGTLTYNGLAQSPTIATNAAYTITNNVQTNAGNYNATVTLNANYAWAGGSTTALTLPWSIATKVLQVSGFNISKVYDGNVTVTNWGTLTFAGLVAGETSTVSTSGVVGSYNNANVGAGKSVSFTGTFAMSGGTASASNYTITQPTGLIGAITPIAVTVTANAKSKVFNAVLPTLDYVSVPASLISGNTFSGSLATTATQTSNVGIYPINQGTFTIASGNYTITYVGADITITPAQITKPLSSGILTYNGMAQSPTIASNAAYVITNNVQTNAGSYSATVTLTSITNYQWADATTSPLSLAWSINPASLTINGFNITKEYDSNVNVTSWGTLSFVGLISGQTSTVSSSGVVGSYNDAIVGTGKLISYTGTFTMNGGSAVASNYEVTQPTGLLGTITAVGGILTLDPIADVTYNGAAHTPVVIVKSGVTTLILNTDYTVSYINNTNAGTATVSVTGIGSYAAATGLGTFTILKVSIAKPTVTSGVITYNGAAQSPTIATNTNYAIAGNTQSNAGSYYATVTLIDPTNFQWTDATNTPLSLAWSITKATYDMSGITMVNATFPFDGLSKSLAISGTLPSGVSVAYDNNGKTAIGVYEVTAIFTGDETNYEAITPIKAWLTILPIKTYTINFNNYDNSLLQTLEVAEGWLPDYTNPMPTKPSDGVNNYTFTGWTPEIVVATAVATYTATFFTNPKTIITIIETPQSFVYDGFAKTFVVVSSPEVSGFDVVYSPLSPTNAGSYDVTITRPTDDTYVAFSKTIVGGLVITKASIPKPIVTGTLTYNGSEQSPTIATNVAYSITDNVQTNAGSYFAAVSLNNITNYQWEDATTTSLSLAWSIEKATYNMSEVLFVSKTIQYDGTIKSLAITGTLPSGVSVTYVNNDKTEVGVYEITANFAGDATNYNTIAPLMATLTITAIPKYTINFNNYEGSLLQTLEVEEGTKPVYTEATPTKPSDDNNHYTFIGWTPEIVVATAVANYKATFIDVPKTIITINETPQSFEFDGTAKEFNVVSTPLLTDFTVVYDPAVPTAVGTYKVTITRPTDDTYAVFSKTIVDGLVITPIPIYTINFNNFDNSLLQKLEVEKGTMPVYTEATPIKPSDDFNNYTFVGWTPEIVVATAVGTYTATFIAVPKTIITLNESPQSFVYDGCAKTFVVISSPEVSGFNVVYSPLSPLSAGIYNVTITRPTDDIYAAFSKTIVGGLEITKATYNMSGISFANATVCYDNTPKSLAISGTLPSGVSVSYTNNDKIFEGVYTVTANFTGNTNYNAIAPMTAILTIERCLRTITFVNWDNSTLLETEVDLGFMPVYSGVTPKKPSDEDFHYSFAGWMPVLVPVTQNETYTAQFFAYPSNGNCDFIEDVELVSGTPSYSGAYLTMATGVYYVKGTTTMDANDRTVEKKSVRLRGSSLETNNVLQMEFDRTEGVGRVNFHYASYASHVNGQIFVEYSTDKGATWIRANSTPFIAPTWNATTGMLQASVEINIAGRVRVRIVKPAQPGNTTVNVDNFCLTDFIDPTEPDIYTINATATTGGTITPSGDTEVVENSDLTYHITTLTGFEYKDLLVDGHSVGIPTTYTFTNIQANHTIHAIFELIPVPTCKVFEDFEVVTGTPNFAGALLTMNSGDYWVKGTTTMDASDRRIGTKSVRLRGNSLETENLLEMRTPVNGVGTVKFNYASYSTHMNGQIFVEYKKQGETVWTRVNTTPIVAPAWNAVVGMKEAEVVVNVAGNLFIRILKPVQSGNTSVNIDNLCLSAFVAPPVAPNDITTVEVTTMKVYPNPTNGFINITLSNLNQTIERVEIIDMAGKLLFTINDKRLTINGEPQSVDMSNFAKGIYFVKVTTSNEVLMSKVVKQ